MSAPNFTTGQKVSLAASKQHPAPQNPYTIMSAMPDNRGGFQYRIKGDLEKFERVIDERFLAAE